jgi:hypothetical protein
MRLEHLALGVHVCCLTVPLFVLRLWLSLAAVIFFVFIQRSLGRCVARIKTGSTARTYVDSTFLQFALFSM